MMPIDWRTGKWTEPELKASEVSEIESDDDNDGLGHTERLAQVIFDQGYLRCPKCGSEMVLTDMGGFTEPSYLCNCGHEEKVKQ